MKRNSVILLVETIVIIGLTFLSKLTFSIKILSLRIGTNVAVYLLLALSAIIAIKLSGVKVDFFWKNSKQFAVGGGVALILSLCLAWIPALCRFSLVGAHINFTLWQLFYNLLYCFLIVGPVEELIFRVYYQKVLTGIFAKCRLLGVILAAALFGLWHLINGSWVQVAFTFGIGLVFGVTKEYVKEVHYPGVAFGHGLYDFLNYVVRVVV
ncbi:MAG: CPBP family intramembrane metalloprotease [Clostridia bacterium]|nr:CPBP family intramembrane metalloprotease [Clostridia bacterium]